MIDGSKRKQPFPHIEFTLFKILVLFWSHEMNGFEINKRENVIQLDVCKETTCINSNGIFNTADWKTTLF